MDPVQVSRHGLTLKMQQFSVHFLFTFLFEGQTWTSKADGGGGDASMQLKILEGMCQ